MANSSNAEVEIVSIFISEKHNYKGRHGQEALSSENISLAEANLVERMGIEGDRFFGHAEDFKGQVTFFEEETFLDLRERFGVFDRGPEAFRRNILTRGIDLNTLIGEEFEIQGIRFYGMEEAAPCYWMDQAFCQGAHEALKGKGGLRAKVLTSGVLRCAE